MATRSANFTVLWTTSLRLSAGHRRPTDRAGALVAWPPLLVLGLMAASRTDAGPSGTQAHAAATATSSFAVRAAVPLSA